MLYRDYWVILGIYWDNENTMETTIVLRTRYASSHLERGLGFRDMTYGALEKGFAGIM